MSSDFDDIGKHSLDEVTKPKLIPAGPWLLRGANMKKRKVEFEDDETGETVKYTQFTFTYEPVEALPGVDQSAVDAGGFDGATVTIRRNVKNAATEYYTKTFIEKHGIDTTGRDWDDIAKVFRGAKIVGNLTEETYKNDDGEEVPINRIDAFQAVQ